MTSQHFRSAKTPEGWVVFPFPPIKGQKWLVLATDKDHASQVLKVLQAKRLPSPLEDDEEKYFKKSGVHSDGQTPLFTLKDENLHS